jgi:hypothetical protein
VALAMELGLTQPTLTKPKLIETDPTQPESTVAPLTKPELTDLKLTDTALMAPRLTEPALMEAKLHFPEAFPGYSPVAFAALFAVVHELLWQRL